MIVQKLHFSHFSPPVRSSCPPSEDCWRHPCLKVDLSLKFQEVFTTQVAHGNFKQSCSQIGKFAECAGDLSFVRIACAAVFVSLNNGSIVSFCCFTKISRLEPRLKFKVRGGEIGRARQTFQSGAVDGMVFPIKLF